MNVKFTVASLTAAAVVTAAAFAAGASTASTTTRTVTRIVRPAPIVVTNTVVKVVRVKVPVIVTKTVPARAAPTPTPTQTTAAPRPAQSQYAGWTVENVATFERQFAATYPMGAYAPNAAALVQNPCAMHWIESNMTYAHFEADGFTPGLSSNEHWNVDRACPGWSGATS